MIWFLFVQHKKKKVDILLNGTPADPLASLVHRSNARDYGLRLVQVIFQFILIFFVWTFRSPRNWGMWFIANCLKWSFRLLAETRFCAEREFLPCERWVQKCVLCHSGLESPGCACQAVWRRCDSQDEAFGQAKEREKANAKHWKRWVGPRSVFCRFEELREGFL